MAEKREPWYVYGLGCMLAIVLAYFAFTDYKGFIHPQRMGSGKSNKFFLLFFNGIDLLGGKWLVLAMMLMIILFLLIKMIRRTRKQ